jgi:hypothetical protein
MDLQCVRLKVDVIVTVGSAVDATKQVVLAPAGYLRSSRQKRLADY